MSETLALLRILLIRSRWLLTGMLIAVGLGELIALLAAPIDIGIAIVALLCTLLPAAVASIGLFDYGDNSDMNLPASGCSKWLLRMPIDAWKIVLVPVILRTVWIAALWTLFVLTIGYLGAKEKIPILAPSICFSAASIWVLVLAWRPFRRGWQRLVAITLAAPVLYGCAAAVLAAPSIKQVDWRSLATHGALVVSIVVYSMGVWIAIKSVRLARINSTGIIPEFGKASAERRRRGDERVRHFRSARRALVWHDMLKARGWVRGTLIAGVLPAIIALSLFVPLNGPNMVLVLLGFAYLGSFVICRTGAAPETPSALPPYLAASPLSSATIAWTRCLPPLAISAGVFFCVLLVFAGWALSIDNRNVWMQWAEERARSLGDADRAVETGIRWSIAIVLASATFFLGRLASLLWIGMAGRTWVNALMSAVLGLASLMALGIVLRWFMTQTDWELTKTSAIGYLSYAPPLVAGLLATKAIAAIGSSVALVRRELCSTGTVLRVVAIWWVTTFFVSSTLYFLVPDPRATFGWCLALTILAIPLARILGQPLALAWNRHR